MKKVFIGLAIGALLFGGGSLIATTFEATTTQNEGKTGLKDLCRIQDANFALLAGGIASTNFTFLSATATTGKLWIANGGITNVSLSGN